MAAAPVQYVTGVLDTRTVGKLADFSGVPNDWQDWSFRAKAWFCLLPYSGNSTVEELLTATENHPTPIVLSALGSHARNFGVVMFNLRLSLAHA